MKWICKTCGYTHYGEDAPERCPQCGAPKSLFSQESSTNWNLVRLLVVLTVTSIILVSVFTCTTSTEVDNSTVKVVDINRYLGRWYEIARLDHWFERNLTNCTATYSIKKDGNIRVINNGIKNGNWKTSEGKAKLTNTPGLLRVSFFGPFYSDYRILMLAPDYSYALVGSGSGKHLWILSRTTQLPHDARDRIIREAQRRGYDTGALIWVEHDS